MTRRTKLLKTCKQPLNIKKGMFSRPKRKCTSGLCAFCMLQVPGVLLPKHCTTLSGNPLQNILSEEMLHLQWLQCQAMRFLFYLLDKVGLNCPLITSFHLRKDCTRTLSSLDEFGFLFKSLIFSIFFLDKQLWSFLYIHPRVHVRMTYRIT